MEYEINCDEVADYIESFMPAIITGTKHYEHVSTFQDATKEEIAAGIAENARRWALANLRMSDWGIAVAAYKRAHGTTLARDTELAEEIENIVYNLRDDSADDETTIAAVVDALK